MKRFYALICILWLASQSALPQADACRGAASALDRVKKDITPELGNGQLDSSAREQLEQMYSTLQTSSRVCNSIGEIFYYRGLIAERLRLSDDVRYAKRKQLELHYQPTYNPFLPSAAQQADAGSPPGPVRRKWAIVVGVSSFQQPTAYPSLKYPTKDADAFEKYLLNPAQGRFEEKRVKKITDNEATTAAFWDRFAWVRDNATPDDLVVIYISSHGTDPDDDKNKVSFIAMNDTSEKAEKLFSTSVEMVDLIERLNREVRARRLVLFLDTCFSGDASAAGRHSAIPGEKSGETSNPFGGNLAKLNVAKGRAVITASRFDEPSWEADAPIESGYFTHFLLTSLREGNQMTLGDLFPKIQAKVSNSVQHDHPGVTQTPSAQFDNRSETFVLSVPEQPN